MTNFERIKNMSADELANWLDEVAQVDISPWALWFDEKYCRNCPAEITYVPAIGRDEKCAWCELHYKCRYFEEMEDTPSIIETIKMWLQEEED